MKTVQMLTKRNMKLYFRDRTTVFFSMLTILIIILLNVIFLGKMNVDTIVSQYPNLEEEARYFVNTWVLAGIIYTSTLTVPLAVIGVMIEDEEQKRMKAFSTSPVKRINLTLGYIFSAFFTGVFMSIFTLFLSQLYIFFTGNEILNIQALIKVILIIILNVFCNASIMFFFVSFIKTASSFSALNIILGTLIGFLAAIYLPFGALATSIQKLLAFLPFLHGASLIRSFYTSTSLFHLFQGAPDTLREEYSDTMGITINLGHGQISFIHQCSFLIICAILCIVLSAFVLSKKNGSDR